MGIQVATMTRGSDLERILAEMRDSHHGNQVSKVIALIPKARRLIELLENDLRNRLRVSNDALTAEINETIAAIEQTRTPTFWDTLKAKPLEGLEFLDTKVAPAAGEGRLMYLRYVGTDLNAFAQHFDRFHVVKGTMVPTGERGMLINQKYADRRLKIMAARLFDALAAGRADDVLIAENPALEAKARQLATQAGAIALKLGPEDASWAEDRLAQLFPKTQGLDALLGKLLAVNDTNFEAHHRFFYEELAPRIALYPFEVGDVLTIRSMTKRGYFKTTNIKIYGTFGFKGLERSDLSGAANLVDLMTFRELYGQMSEAENAELQDIRQGAGARVLRRDSAEDALFGGPDETIEEPVVDTDGFSEFEGLDLRRGKRTFQAAEPFTQEQLDRGLVISAAVMLHDAEKLEATMTALQRQFDDAGLALKVIDWRTASGILGQMAILVRIILYVAIFIIFTVALVIINNSMLMATLE